MGYWGQGRDWHLNLFTFIFCFPIKEKVFRILLSKVVPSKYERAVPDKKSQEHWISASRRVFKSCMCAMTNLRTEGDGRN